MTVPKKACPWTISTHCRLAVVLALSTLSPVEAAVPTAAHTLKVIVQPGFLPQIPTLLRVELLAADGQPDRNVWDAEAILSETASGITLSTNRILLRNGLGTGLINITGSGDFDLQVTVGPLQVTRLLRDRSADPVARTGGSLPGTATTWNGIVNVTNDLTVPSGHTLTIEPDTLVLINGVASGTVAADILINGGSVQSLGTEAEPITITCANPGLRWGQIRHNTAQPSLYRFTAITRAGHATREGHTTTAPAIRPTNSRIVFESSVISDHADANGLPGKIMQASGSDLVFNSTVLARSRMGPEIAGTGLLVTNSYIMEMFGPDDADGIYIHDAGSRIATLIDSVFALGHDDAIDTLSSLVNVHNCIIRNWLHPTEDCKGISAFNRIVDVKRCLIVDCLVGISAKAAAGNSVLVYVNETTIIAVSNSLAANFKSNAQGPVVDLRITNSIILGPDPIKTDFGTTNFAIGYCALGEDWAGTGNFVADPAFVDVPNHDFHLRAGSPCIDTGNPASPLDPDGSRIDIGSFTFEVPRPLLSSPRLSGGAFEFLFFGYTNRNYAIDYSTNGQTWGILTTISHSEDPETISDSMGNSHTRIYRARLVP